MFLAHFVPNMVQINPHNIQNRKLYRYRIVIFALNYKNDSPCSPLKWCRPADAQKVLTPLGGVVFLHKTGKVTNW